MTMLRRRLAFMALLATIFVPAAAHADDRTTAHQLFEQGKALMASGKVSEACPKFEGAAQLSQTPGVRLNLAECWVKLGRTASAWAKYAEALALAERSGDAAAAALARKGRAALEPKLSFLTVSVAKDARVPGLEITRDGESFPEAAWGTAVPVDPGEHEVSARAPGRERWSVKRDVATPGAKEDVVVPLLVEEEKTSPPPSPVAPTPSEPAPAVAEVSRGGTQRTLAFVSGGLGILGLGVGTAFGLKTISKKSDYEAHVGPNGSCLDETCQTASHDAYAAGNISTIAFVAGGALLATGVVLWLTAPSSRVKGASMRVAPVVGAQEAGLMARGTW